jgi:hypothetical protein
VPFPESCIRGVPHEQFINDDGTVRSDLFYFDDVDRGDGWNEQSVNWMDDDNALAHTLHQRRDDGRYQFGAGAVVFPKAEIERINALPTVAGLLDYERRPLDDNPYHGNILLRKGTDKGTMKMIAANIALSVWSIHTRN